MIITHTNKDSRSVTAMHRIGGSLGGIAGFARSVLFVGEHGGRKVVVVATCNLAPKPPAVSFNIVENGAVWGEELSDVTADQLVTKTPAAGERRVTRLEHAMLWLRDTLEGGERPFAELREEADQGGISPATLKEAKRELGVVSRKDGMHGGWVWGFPDEWIPDLPIGGPSA